MLMVLFYLGSDKYAIETVNLVRVLPAVAVKKIVNSPPYVSGIINFGGIPIPLVDLCMLIEGRPCNNCLHTRILLFKFIELDGQVYDLGFLAEKVTQTINRNKSDFIDSKIRINEKSFLDGLLQDEEGAIQFIDDEELFKTMKRPLFEQMKVDL